MMFVHVEKVPETVQALQTWTNAIEQMAHEKAVDSQYQEILLFNTGELGFVKKDGSLGYFKSNVLCKKSEVILREHGGLDLFVQQCQPGTIEFVLIGSRKVVFRASV
jgi:hypothetical protein